MAATCPDCGNLCRTCCDSLIGEAHRAACPKFPSQRRFLLRRQRDVSGVSGTGYVAEGVRFSNGRCVLSWLRSKQAVGVYDSIEDVIAIHGHEGATEVEWVDA